MPGTGIFMGDLPATPGRLKQTQTLCVRSQTACLLWYFKLAASTNRIMESCAVKQTDGTSWWFAGGRRAPALSGRPLYQKGAWWSSRPAAPWWQRSRWGVAAWRSSDPPREPGRGCSRWGERWRFSPASTPRPRRWPVLLQIHHNDMNMKLSD